MKVPWPGMAISEGGVHFLLGMPVRRSLLLLGDFSFLSSEIDNCSESEGLLSCVGDREGVTRLERLVAGTFFNACTM